MKVPQVSIIMATYNRAHFILETLESIIGQSYQNWECIIVDDGGTDNTADVLNPILKSDVRFQYVKRSNLHEKGLPGCRNYGIHLAKGEYIIFFDDDDIVHPENLALCVKHLKLSDKDFCRYQRDVFHGTFHFDFDKQTQCPSSPLDGKNIVGDMITGVLPFNSCTVMWKKSCFDDTLFDESLLFAEEWECYSRILMNGFKGITIDKVLFYGRKHSNSNTGEYQSKNPVRTQSKVKAAQLIISNLNANGLLNYKMAKYFLALSKSLNAPSVYKHILTQASLSNSDKNKLKNRNRYHNLIVAMYKTKKMLSSTYKRGNAK